MSPTAARSDSAPHTNGDPVQRRGAERPTVTLVNVDISMRVGFSAEFPESALLLLISVRPWKAWIIHPQRILLYIFTKKWHKRIVIAVNCLQLGSCREVLNFVIVDQRPQGTCFVFNSCFRFVFYRHCKALGEIELHGITTVKLDGFLSSARLLSFYRRSATSTTLPLAVIVLGCMLLRYKRNSNNYNCGLINVLHFSKKVSMNLNSQIRKYDLFFSVWNCEAGIWKGHCSVTSAIQNRDNNLGKDFKA